MREGHFALLPIFRIRLAFGLLGASIVAITTAITLLAFAGLEVYAAQLAARRGVRGPTDEREVEALLDGFFAQQPEGYQIPDEYAKLQRQELLRDCWGSLVRRHPDHGARDGRDARISTPRSNLRPMRLRTPGGYVVCQ